MNTKLGKLMVAGTMAVLGLCLAVSMLFASQSPPEAMKVSNNLGARVNSISKDIGPIISADGNSLYFTSDREGGMGGQDIWVSKRVGGRWAEPVNIGEPLNTAGDEGPDTFSQDEKTLYFTARGRDDSVGGSDIYVSHFNEGKWSEPENLGRRINSKYDEANASLSADGKKLYFSSNRPGGMGAWDIWVSTKLKKGWSRPKNMGKNINSSGWETNAFILPDGQTLYFASNGRGGYGGSDIFKSTLQKGRFSEAMNLGSLINTEQNDTYFTVPASGDLVYFSSDQPGGIGLDDIYAIPMRSSFKPKPIAILKGNVISADTDKPLDAGVSLKSNVGRDIAKGATNEKGIFKISVMPEKELILKVYADGYKTFYEYLDLDSSKLITVKEYSIKLVPEEKDK